MFVILMLKKLFKLSATQCVLSGRKYKTPEVYSMILKLSLKFHVIMVPERCNYRDNDVEVC